MKVSERQIRNYISEIKDRSKTYFHELAKGQFGEIYRKNMQVFEEVISHLWRRYAQVPDEQPYIGSLILRTIATVAKDYTISLQEGPGVALLEQWTPLLEAKGWSPQSDKPPPGSIAKETEQGKP